MGKSPCLRHAACGRRRITHSGDAGHYWHSGLGRLTKRKGSMRQPTKLIKCLMATPGHLLACAFWLLTKARILPVRPGCPNTPNRKIPRSIYEDARDVARTACTTAAYAQSRKDRKKVEMMFAHLKRILKLDRLRLRGIKGARDEFPMAAAVQNLRRMARRLAPTQEIGNAIAV